MMEWRTLLVLLLAGRPESSAGRSGVGGSGGCGLVGLGAAAVVVERVGTAEVDLVNGSEESELLSAMGKLVARWKVNFTS